MSLPVYSIGHIHNVSDIHNIRHIHNVSDNIHSHSIGDIEPRDIRDVHGVRIRSNAKQKQQRSYFHFV
uniref:Uncharacterized protein n=1 Tax=viral metagenome TaxID=1070528 RepID=A0A6C0M176_9ZZZZ